LLVSRPHNTANHGIEAGTISTTCKNTDFSDFASFHARPKQQVQCQTRPDK
jgi:hypothetical protein